MYDLIQSALTYIIDAIALTGLIGIPLHAIAKHHIEEVRRWGVPRAVAAPQAQTEPNSTPQSQVTQEVEEDTELNTTVLPPLESPDLPCPSPWDEPFYGEVISFQRRPIARHFSPTLALPPAKEEPKSKKTKNSKTPAKPKAPSAPAAKTRTRSKRSA